MVRISITRKRSEKGEKKERRDRKNLIPETIIEIDLDFTRMFLKRYDIFVLRKTNKRLIKQHV
jgi:hypothetical protein